MRRLIPAERHDDVVTAVVFRARLSGRGHRLDAEKAPGSTQYPATAVRL